MARIREWPGSPRSQPRNARISICVSPPHGGPLVSPLEVRGGSAAGSAILIWHGAVNTRGGRNWDSDGRKWFAGGKSEHHGAPIISTLPVAGWTSNVPGTPLDFSCQPKQWKALIAASAKIDFG